MLRRLLFAAALVFTLTPWSSPPLALALGLVLGLSVGNPFPQQSRRASKTLLQTSVVALGFGMNFHQVVKAGTTGVIYTAAGIILTLAAGMLLGRMLKIGARETTLISVGTAICGGSAIAAVAPIIGAKDEQISVSLATVFILNSIALLIFPPLGVALGMAQTDFGLWAALAIHDTSSVVGASERFGPAALAVGTVVKLTRALWIVPIALITAAIMKKKGKVQWPWFIAAFVAAALIATYLPAGAEVYRVIVLVGRIGLAVTLFLIGSSISRKTIAQVGVRPLLHGVVLWLLVGSATLYLITSGAITF